MSKDNKYTADSDMDSDGAMNGDYIDQLSEIRSLMEKSSRFISLSGWSGIMAGIYALIGAYVAKAYYFGHSDIYSERLSELIGGPYLFQNLGYYGFFILDAGLVVGLALITGMVFTAKRAKKNGQRIWDRVALRMLVNLAIPLFTGGVFCIMLMEHKAIGLVAPAMLIFYGLALVNASKYSIYELKFFGMAQIALGLIASYYIGHGLMFWAIGFGFFHIIYGAYMWLKYER